MYCLYNGEYGEHDLSYVPGIDKPGGAIDRQNRQYAHYIGMVVGDFTCLDVEYDWGRRDQRWKIKCNICGKEKYQYHTSDWRRGKGRKTTCECRKIAEKQKRQQEKIDHRSEYEKRLELQAIDDRAKYIGNVYDGWEITDCFKHGQCSVRCSVCGREIKSRRSIQKVVSGAYAKCKHPNDYAGDEWIGRRSGNLVVKDREGKMFRVLCDCGKETIVRPVEMFTYKTKTCCGQPECPYLSATQRESAKRKEVGEEYEKDISRILVMKGYKVEATKTTGDFGVDIIAICPDGERMAIQCKCHKWPQGVEAVQEVYAGGRYYDCTRFAVVSDSGFTDNAVLMAKKLGVYLSDESFNYPGDIQKYCNSLLPTYKGLEKAKKYYEIDGVKHTFGDWCALYGKTPYYVRKLMHQGASLDVALKAPKVDSSWDKVYTANGITGKKEELCKHFDISPQLVNYRLKKGMSLEDALTTPKGNSGKRKGAV